MAVAKADQDLDEYRTLSSDDEKSEAPKITLTPLENLKEKR